MYAKILISISLISLIFLFSPIPIAAQTSRPQRPLSVPKKNEPLWGWPDAAFLSSLALDEISTHQALSSCPSCREVGVIENPWARIGAKAGLFGAIKLLEWKAGPENRRASRWIKIGLAGVFMTVAIRNFSVGQGKR